MKWIIKWKVKGSLRETFRGKDIFESETKPTKEEMENLADKDINDVVYVSNQSLPNLANAVNQCNAGCSNFWILSVKKLKGEKTI